MPSPVHILQVARSIFAVDALARLLEATYGLEDVRCQLIKGTIRDTYHVASRDGPYILSIYRHGRRSVAEIAAELELLDYLAANSVLVAPGVRQRSGERLLAIEAPEGVRYGVLFIFIPGHHLARQPVPALAQSYGRAIGQMHRLADNLPSALNRPRIDVEQMLDRPLAAFASVVTHRPADVAFLREVAALLRPTIAALPTEPTQFGLVHGDVIPSNAQVTPEGEIGLLDFDFCGYGWRVYDLATYLGEVRFWRADPACADAFLAGYEEVRSLVDWERAAILLFEVARHVQSLGTPAENVNEWGSAYLSDRMIDTLLDNIRESLSAIS